MEGAKYFLSLPITSHSRRHKGFRFLLCGLTDGRHLVFIILWFSSSSWFSFYYILSTAATHKYGACVHAAAAGRRKLLPGGDAAQIKHQLCVCGFYAFEIKEQKRTIWLHILSVAAAIKRFGHKWCWVIAAY